MNSRNLRVLKQMQNEEKHQLGLVKWTRVYSIASVIMGLATVVLLWVNWSWISIARDQLAASVDPGVELVLRNDTLWVKNEGVTNLKAVRIELALYFFDSTSSPRLRSMFNHPIFERDCISRGDSARVLLEKWHSVSLFQMKPQWATPYVALVLHFRREIDNRGYLIVRSFAEGGDGWFPLFHVNGIGSSLPIPSSYHVAESILNTELKLYHTEQAEAEDLSR